jgi:hypothetical protein
VGSCHCQAVKFGVLSKVLEEAGIDDCGCSICAGVSPVSLDRLISSNIVNVRTCS